MESVFKKNAKCNAVLSSHVHAYARACVKIPGSLNQVNPINKIKIIHLFFHPLKRFYKRIISKNKKKRTPLIKSEMRLFFARVL